MHGSVCILIKDCKAIYEFIKVKERHVDDI